MPVRSSRPARWWSINAGTSTASLDVPSFEPSIDLLAAASQLGATWMVKSSAGMPTITRLPIGATMSMAPARAACAPVVTNRWSASGPPVAAVTAAARSSTVGSNTCVAPNLFAASLLPAMGSTATIVAAPAMRAAWMAPIPTPPQPTTTTASPSDTPAVLVTAPEPVRTPQPRRHASTRSTSSGSRVTCERWTTTWVAKPATLRPWGMRLPSASDRGLQVESANSPLQTTSCPLLHARHSPQVRMRETRTGSPVARSSTPLPVSAMRPAASWPRTSGNVVGHVPST